MSVTPTEARRSAASTGSAHSAEAHRGFEIFYAPEVSGWQYRDSDANASPLSYRSAFLARKAVDEIAEAGSEAATKPRRSAKKPS